MSDLVFGLVVLGSGVVLVALWAWNVAKDHKRQQTINAVAAEYYRGMRAIDEHANDPLYVDASDLVQPPNPAHVIRDIVVAQGREIDEPSFDEMARYMDEPV